MAVPDFFSPRRTWRIFSRNLDRPFQSGTRVETSAVIWGRIELSYTIRRSPRRKKTVAVTVDPAGSILVVAPMGVGTDRLDTIVGRKAEWIARRIRRAESQGPLLSPREFVSGESVRYLGRHYRLKVNPGETGSAKLRGGWLHVPAPGGSEDAAVVRAGLVSWFRRRAAERLPERVEAWHAKAGVPMPRVKVVSQRKRWGSCDQAGTIRLNWRIVQAPMRSGRSPPHALRRIQTAASATPALRSGTGVRHPRSDPSRPAARRDS